MENAGNPNLKDAFRPRTVGITAPGVDRVVADKGRDLLPALGRARPLVSEEPKLSRYL